MKRLILSAGAAALALATASSALAQPGPGGGPPPGGGNPAFAAVRAACAADFQKLCADAPAGPGRFQCLRDKQDQVSPDCKAAMAALPARPPGAPPMSSAPAGK